MRRYFKDHIWTVLYLVCCFVILTVVFTLYRLPLAPVLYVLGLCLVLGVVVTGIRYMQYRSRHRLLEALATEISDSIAHLPQPEIQLEKDYQALLRRLQTVKAELVADSDYRYRDMLEYYTMWVHQIKTPIAAMQLVLQAEDTPEHLELRSELFKIQQYVEVVLCYLRLSSTATDFLFRSCELDTILRKSVHTYAGQFVRSKTKLVYEPMETSVLTDEKWLQFVIEQLLSNALKYAPGGTVTIRLEGDCTLVIQDDGIGIAPEDLPRIFEKGFTGLNGRGFQRSTGIGLYLCRKIIRRLGHSISISSELGKGTVVRLGLAHKPLELD